MIRFILHLIFKKAKKMPLDYEMEELLKENNYTPLEEWKTSKIKTTEEEE